MSAIKDRFSNEKQYWKFKGKEVEVIFDLIRAKEIIEFCKANSGEIVLIDYECFQLKEDGRIKMEYDERNVPFLVCLSTLNYDESKDMFYINRENSFRFSEKIADENFLMDKLENLAKQISKYMKGKKYYINAGGRTERYFHRFAVKNWKIQIIRDNLDLWEDFYNERTFFNIINKIWKIRNLVNQIDNNDKIPSREIGEKCTDFFIDGIELPFKLDLIQKHCFEDIEKMLYFINKINYLIQNKTEKINEYFLEDDKAIEIV